MNMLYYACMNKINKSKISYGAVSSLILIAILSFNFAAINQADASYDDYYYYSGSSARYYGGTKVDNTYQTPSYNYNPAPSVNPAPVINSLSPKGSNVGTGTKTITITGSGFIPSSVARINGSNRPTTFIDSTHLLMQITGNDTYLYRSNGGFFITVFNKTPGGGYSNAVFFTINKTAASSAGTSNSNNANDTYSNFTDENGNSDISNLASNALFGANGLFPSGLIQWILFAILILLIVILVRKVYG